MLYYIGMVFIKNALKSRFYSCTSGSSIILVFVAAAMLASLSFVFFNQMSNVPNNRKIIEARAEAQEIINAAAAIRAAVETMMAEGGTPDNINDITDGSAAFNTAPHTAKIYHPYGGGISYRQNIKSWNDIRIHMDARIENIGDSALDDIMVVGEIQSEIACQQINYILSGDDTIPEVNTAQYDDIMDGTSSVLIDDAAACTSGGCDGAAYQCIESVGGGYGFYYLLASQ